MQNSKQRAAQSTQRSASYPPPVSPHAAVIDTVKHHSRTASPKNTSLTWPPPVLPVAPLQLPPTPPSNPQLQVSAAPSDPAASPWLSPGSGCQQQPCARPGDQSATGLAGGMRVCRRHRYHHGCCSCNRWVGWTERTENKGKQVAHAVECLSDVEGVVAVVVVSALCCLTVQRINVLSASKQR